MGLDFENLYGRNTIGNTGALSSLSLELSAVVQRHFDAYIASTTAVAAPNLSKPYSLPTTRPLSGLS
jgi:hypothetical protein